MNRPIRGVAVTAMTIFAALMINLSYIYVGQQNYLNERPENRRVADARFAQDRGPIMVGNTPIAKSEAVKDRYKFQRSYTSGELYAQVTGYYSYLYRTSALEASLSSELSGVDDSQFISRLLDSASGSTQSGATVETTLDAKAQRAAWDGLDGRKGAVVAIDYSTGAIKALVSFPSYDPNDLATHDLTASSEAWKRLNADTDKPMANRATREIYPPGSTFKVVTAAAALDAGLSPDTLIDATAYKLPGSTRVISGSCGGSKITLTRALEVSCNPAFARLGVKLGDEALRVQAQKFGFGTRFLDEIGSAASRFPEEVDQAQTAMSAIGEFEVAARPPRRGGDGPVPGPARPRQRPAGDQRDPGATAVGGDEPGERRVAAGDDGLRGAAGHGIPGTDPRRHRRWQDRHGTLQQRTSAVRMVYGLGRRPPGGGLRIHRGRGDSHHGHRGRTPGGTHRKGRYRGPAMSRLTGWASRRTQWGGWAAATVLRMSRRKGNCE